MAKGKLWWAVRDDDADGWYHVGTGRPPAAISVPLETGYRIRWQYDSDTNLHAFPPAVFERRFGERYLLARGGGPVLVEFEATT